MNKAQLQAEEIKRLRSALAAIEVHGGSDETFDPVVSAICRHALDGSDAGWVNLSAGRQKRVTVREIIESVARRHSLSSSDIIGPNKKRRYANARTEAIKLARELTGLSLPTLGRIFKRDHTTIMYHLRREYTPDEPGTSEGCRAA